LALHCIDVEGSGQPEAEMAAGHNARRRRRANARLMTRLPKVLGAVALLVPRRPLLKEWAYAGAFFTYTGAIVSHLTTG
jgi:hypothetical protein